MDSLEVRRTRPAKSNVSEPLRETGSQTAGPYVHIGCLPNMAGVTGIYPTDLTSNRELKSSHKISISGQVFEGDGIISKDIMLEFWQADENGSLENGFWSRAGTDLEDGTYEIETIIPGSFPDNKGSNLAPFVSVWIVARGINIGLSTRIYFPDFEAENSKDPHLSLVPEDRKHTLVAVPGPSPQSYVFNVHLQGKHETVFFES